MQFAVFVDPMYHGEKHIHFEPSEVVAIEEKTVSLFLRGKFSVTYVTLKDGTEHALKGSLRAQIEAAQVLAAGAGAASTWQRQEE